MIELGPLTSTGLEVFTPVFLFLLLGHFMAIGWGFNDAKEHSDQPAIVWAILIGALPVIGLLSYTAVVRDDIVLHEIRLLRWDHS